VVTIPEVSAVRDADRIIGLLAANDLHYPELVINRLRIDMVKRGDMINIEDTLDILGIDLLGVVPDDESIVISTNKGEPVIATRNSLAGKAFVNIAKRIEGLDVPIMNLDEDNSIVDRLKRLFGIGKK
jgi:septum site-determining protein MinD